MRAASFDECFREHYPRLVAYSVAVSGDRDLGREFAQEAFVRLHAHWARIATYDQPGAWLRRVVANLAIDHHRAASSERRAIERLAARPPVTSTPSTSSGSERWSDLVAGLPPRQRAIVTLHYGEDLSVADIAELLDLSVNTVKSALAKSRDKLRAALAEREDHDA